MSALALPSLPGDAEQWVVPATAFSLLILCAILLLVKRSRRRRTEEALNSIIETTSVPHEEPEALSWQERVLAFAVEMRGSLSTDSLQDVILRALPPLLGVDRLWIETHIGDHRRLIAAPAADGAPANPTFVPPGEWAMFPLQGEDRAIGVLGIPIDQRPLTSSNRRALEVLAPLISDSLQTAHAIAHLRELSTVDPMTGCATRREGLDRLRAELKRAHRAAQQVAILMLDLDHFKSINDRYGHQCGDAVLAAIGGTIMQTLRVSDLRSRWGGEEFLVALPESGLEQARQVAVVLARRIAATATEYESNRIQVTTSVGITIASPGEEDPEPVLARADAALYRAKADGRNCIRIMLPDPPVIAASPAHALPFRDRRDPRRSDRRNNPGPGRRATDFQRAQPRPDDALVIESRGRLLA